MLREIRGRRWDGDGYLRGQARLRAPHRRAVWPYALHREAVSFNGCYVAYALQEIAGLMRRIRDEQGITIVFIEQNVELALRLADRGYIMESGRTILDGASAELLQSAEVKRIFLGDLAL